MTYNTTLGISDDILDQLEEAQPCYTVEELDGYFICSREYWSELSPKKQMELIKQHPHLEDFFAE